MYSYNLLKRTQLALSLKLPLGKKSPDAQTKQHAKREEAVWSARSAKKKCQGGSSASQIS
jgi:hypothetical protein